MQVRSDTHVEVQEEQEVQDGAKVFIAQADKQVLKLLQTEQDPAQLVEKSVEKSETASCHILILHINPVK